MYWIEVDGRVLVDHDSVVNDSGNGNNYHTDYFSVRPLPNDKWQDWVGTGTWQWYKTVKYRNQRIRHKQWLFDADGNNGPTAAAGNPGYIRYTPNTPISFNTKIEFFVSVDSDSVYSRCKI